MTEENIKRTVKSLSFMNFVTESTLAHMGIDGVHASSKPPYTQEINKMVSKLNETVGSTWASLKTRKPLKVLDGNAIDEAEYPWVKIDAALKEFPKWIGEHSDVFTMDHTFVDQAINPGAFQFH